MILRSFVTRTLEGLAGTDRGIRLLKPWQHGTLNAWITHYYGERRPHLYDVGQDFSVANFRKRLVRARQFFDFVTVRQLLTGPPQPNHVALTFDDGLDLEREGVMDVLADLEVPATFYLIPPCLDNARLMWRHALAAVPVLAGEAAACAAYESVLGVSVGSSPQGARLAMEWGIVDSEQKACAVWRQAGLPDMEEYVAEHRPYFTRAQVRRLLGAGHEIGFHTLSHVDCSRLEMDSVEEELLQPALVFRKEWDLDWLTLAYPYGRRLGPDLEAAVFAKGVFDALFGTSGCAAVGTARSQLERLDVELDWEQAIYRTPGRELLLKRLRP